MDRNALIRALRDTAQSASNAIASNVSGPVDLIAAGLRGVGLPIPQNPVGGSQWMAERGLTAPVQQGVAQVIGDTIGLAGPALVANFAPQIARALNQGAQNLAAPRTLRPETGAIVWHGSPHKFDRFDSSKIGTGEGAQAYGHGLYLAESPDVAKSYQTALSAERGFSFGGKTGLTRAQVEDMANAKYGDVYLDGVIRPSGVAGSFIDDMVTGVSRPPGFYPRQYKPGSERAKLYDELRGQVTHADPGSLYKVDLPDEQIARMLDWDKPLSQQPKNVQEFVKQRAARQIQEANKSVDGWGDLGSPYRFMDETSGSQFLQSLRDGSGSLQNITGGGGRDVSEMLRDAGIPGIRYLDGGSRGVGQGTSNFVVFPGNENILQILERNGQPLGLMGVRNRQAGAVYAGGPRQEALDTAQRNAAKPVSEGGLGLPPNNTPMDRARAMGFVDDTYHGTFNRFDNFDMAKANPRSQYMPGVFTADQPELAENFGDYIMPLMQRKGVTIKDVIAARNAGLPKPTVDSIHDAANGVRVTNNPSNLRSRFAAFDPARINENDLLGRADPRLLGLMGLGAAGGLGAYNYMQGQ